MTRWTHGHTAATGIAAGLLLDRHTLLVAAVALTAGFFARELVGAGRHGLHQAARVSQAAVDLAEQKVVGVREANAARAERTQQSRREREKARAQAYEQGAADVLLEQASIRGRRRA